MQWRQSNRTQKNSTCTEQQEKRKHFHSQAHSDASCSAFLPRHFTYLHPVFQLQKQRISSYQLLLQSPSSTLQCAIYESTIIPQVAHSTFWEGEHMAHAVLLSVTAVLPFSCSNLQWQWDDTTHKHSKHYPKWRKPWAVFWTVHQKE